MRPSENSDGSAFSLASITARLLSWNCKFKLVFWDFKEKWDSHTESTANMPNLADGTINISLHKQLLQLGSLIG